MDAYRRLYLRVVLQQVEDYCTTRIDPKNPYVREEAEKWFKDNSPDYQDVCAYARVCSRTLRHKILTGNSEGLKRLIYEYRRLM